MIGIISLVVLAVAILARYGRRLRGPWRAIYVVCATLALYLNVFVGVVQAFLKVAQLLVLTLFVVLTVLAAKRFRLEATARGTMPSRTAEAE